MTVIALRDVRREYRLGSGTVQAVRGVSFDVAAGEWAAVVGPSGCGKSTLLLLLGAIDRPTSGTVRLNDRDVGAMSDREATGFRLRNVGFVFQRFYLMPTLGARENVELPMAEAGMGRRERADRAQELLSYVGLAQRGDHRPALLLADEPTGELDARTGAEIIELLGRLNADGTTIMVVTHDATLASAARRVIQMRDGVVERDGAP